MHADQFFLKYANESGTKVELEGFVQLSELLYAAFLTQLLIALHRHFNYALVMEKGVEFSLFPFSFPFRQPST
jgi:hypothetical protein